MAQLVAHLLCKQRVAGSNPASSTESFILDSQQQKIPQKCGIFCMCACFMRRCSCIWNNLFNYECNHECNYECIYGCNHWCNHEKLFAQKKANKEKSAEQKNWSRSKTVRILFLTVFLPYSDLKVVSQNDATLRSGGNAAFEKSAKILTNLTFRRVIFWMMYIYFMCRHNMCRHNMCRHVCTLNKEDMHTMLDSIQTYLMCKYGDKIENRWFWMFVALAILAWIIAYSFYCTSQGSTFSEFGKV